MSLNVKENVANVVLVVVAVVALVAFFAILMSQDWQATPLGELPPLFWALYLTFVAALGLLSLLSVRVARLRVSRNKQTAVAFIIIGAIILLLTSLLDLWTGRKVLLVTLGTWFAVDGGWMLVRLLRA